MTQQGPQEGQEAPEPPIRPTIPQLDPATRAVAVQRAQNAALLSARNMGEIVEAQLSIIEGLATIGSFIVKSGLFPATVDTPEKGGIIAMTAFELGLTIAQAARFIDVIEGRPFIRARMRMALVNSRGPGRMMVTARTAEYATVRGERPGFPITEVTYRLTDAQRAGLLSKKAWQSNPIEMMVARASATLADILWPEVGAGLPPAEDGEALVADDDSGGEATILEGEFVVVADPVDDPSRAVADATLAAAAGRSNQGSRDRRQPPIPHEAAGRANHAMDQLIAAMRKAEPPLFMRDIVQVVFPDRNPTGGLTPTDLDRWLFEGTEDDPRSVDGIIAEAIRRRGR